MIDAYSLMLAALLLTAGSIAGLAGRASRVRPAVLPAAALDWFPVAAHPGGPADKTQREMKRNIVLSITVVFLLGLVFLIGYDIVHQGINALSVLAMIIVAFFGLTVVGALISRDQQDVKSLLSDEDRPSQRPFWDDSDRI